MTETPSSFGRRVFRSRNIVFSSLQGTAVFIVLATFYAFNLRRGESEEANRTVTFFLFVYANLMLVAVHCPVNELWNNVRLQIITFLTLAALVSIMSWPELRSSFKFVSFPPASLLPLVIAMLLVTSTILILQAVRLTLDRR